MRNVLPPYMPDQAHNVTAKLARALGVPATARRAVLTLEVGELPMLDVEMYASDQEQRDGPDASKVAAVPFMLRLRMEPFR
jgi:hypothetical protein